MMGQLALIVKGEKLEKAIDAAVVSFSDGASTVR